MTDSKIQINDTFFIQVEKNNLTQHLFPDEDEIFKCCICLKLLSKSQAETHKCQSTEMDIDNCTFTQISADKYKCQVCTKVVHFLLLKAHAHAHNAPKPNSSAPSPTKLEEKTPQKIIENPPLITPTKFPDPEEKKEPKPSETPKTPLNFDPFLKIAKITIEKFKKKPQEKAVFNKSFIKATEKTATEKPTKKINEENFKTPPKAKMSSLSQVISSNWSEQSGQDLPIKRSRPFENCSVTMTLRRARLIENAIFRLCRVSARTFFISQHHSFRLWKRNNNIYI